MRVHLFCLAGLTLSGVNGHAVADNGVQRYFRNMSRDPSNYVNDYQVRCGGSDRFESPLGQIKESLNMKKKCGLLKVNVGLQYLVKSVLAYAI